jgi:hypothetical protein
VIDIAEWCIVILEAFRENAHPDSEPQEQRYAQQYENEALLHYVAFEMV